MTASYKNIMFTAMVPISFLGALSALFGVDAVGLFQK